MTLAVLSYFLKLFSMVDKHEPARLEPALPADDLGAARSARR
jgi:hypothetical protein